MTRCVKVVATREDKRTIGIHPEYPSELLISIYYIVVTVLIASMPANGAQ